MQVLTGGGAKTLSLVPGLRVVQPWAGDAWTPLKLASLGAWWKFTDPTTLYTDVGRSVPVSGDGEIIKGVADKSERGIHLSSAVGAQYKTNILDGYSVARFNGTDQMLVSDVVSSWSHNAGTLFVVYKSSGDTNYDVVYQSTGAHSSYWRYSGDGKSYFGNFITVRCEFFSSLPSSGWNIHALRMQTSFEHWKDGTMLGSVAKTWKSPATGTISVAGGGTGGYLAGDIAEIIIFDDRLSDGEMDTVGAYIVRYLPSLTWT